jgi:glutamate N-acetyltransferase / amino-acid N-acetyltransferase
VPLRLGQEVQAVLRGGRLTPRGFTYSAVCADVKGAGGTRPDLGLIFCDHEAVASGLFTTNAVKAAPVLIGMEQSARGSLRAVLANAGNANACTGGEGMDHARTLMAEAARCLSIAPELVCPMSTGVIGVRLPVDRMIARIPELVSGLSDYPEPFARSIMTTDTFQKVATRTVGKATILGMAKGAGMIAPDMATTLAVVLTDAIISKQDLDNIIKRSIERTFNAVTIDGDTSTNDTLMALASGYVTENTIELERGIFEVIRDLALLIVKDGEGATKNVAITVQGARSTADAKKAAMAVGNSLLVKTALFGADPNWGRLVAAVGYSRAEVDPDRIGVVISGYPVVKSGREAEGFREESLHALLKEKDIAIAIDLGLGNEEFTVYTTDLSYDYVKINAEYRT